MPKILSASVPLCVVVRSTHVAYGITGREFGEPVVMLLRPIRDACDFGDRHRCNGRANLRLSMTLDRWLR
jgi:hypothetical protein